MGFLDLRPFLTGNPRRQALFNFLRSNDTSKNRSISNNRLGFSMSFFRIPITGIKSKFRIGIPWYPWVPHMTKSRLFLKTYHEQLKVKLKFTTSTSLKFPTTTSSTIGVKHFLMKSKKENFRNLTKTICKNSTSCNGALCSMLLTISRYKRVYLKKI